MKYTYRKNCELKKINPKAEERHHKVDGGKFNEVLVSRKRETTGYKCTSYRIRNGNFNVQTETDKKEFAKCNSQYTM